MSEFLKALSERVLLCDGAFGSRIQAMDLDVERDYRGAENCTEILNASRPEIVREIHAGYLDAGSDIVQTNSFGGSPLTLAEFDLADQAFELNRLAGELAREAVEEASARDGRQRFVLGSIGPGTRLPSLGHIDYQTLEDAFFTQASGLVAGGVDAILIETCQDPLQIKSAVNGARRAFAELERALPIFVQVTVETTGTLLVGADIAAAATVVHSLGVDSMGLNCATGPHEMAENVRWLSENWPGLITVQPNAGLPELHDGHTHYPLTPAELGEWGGRFVADYGVNMVGGCCGSTIDHIRALDGMLREVAEDGYRPAPAERNPDWTPSLASLYSQVALRQENAILSIGERCNANGSKKFRDLQAAEDWDGCVEIGREQIREASHTLDVCFAPARGGRCAAGDRLHRAAGAGRGAATGRRQADHKLDQFRERRRGGRGAAGTGAQAWRRGDCADHRRGRHGEDRGRQATRRRTALRHGGKPLRPAAVGPAVRSSDLHRLHRYGGRPQAGHRDAERHRTHRGTFPRMSGHPGPVEHLLRAEGRGAPCVELGLPGRGGEARHDRRHHPCQ
jgi:methionine synthase I (cobalamin-dependent)